MTRPPFMLWVSSAILLAVVAPLVVAHTGEHSSHDAVTPESGSLDHAGSHGEHIHPSTVALSQNVPATYYNHPEHVAWIYAHIILMTIAWVILLPIAILISTAGSRLAISTQVLFLTVNGFGLLASVVYNSKTPDLYPNNAHHKAGWAVTWIAFSWVLLGILHFRRLRNTGRVPADGTHSVTAQSMAQYSRIQDFEIGHDSRYSRDSGHGTERNSSSFGGLTRINSAEDVLSKPIWPASSTLGNLEETVTGSYTDHENIPLAGQGTIGRFMTRRVRTLESPRLQRGIHIVYTILERLQVILSFLVLTTGFAIWVGLFRGDGLLNGLAHWIKGGIFFWYGLLTLGRWMGAFADLGWAWNAKPDHPLVPRAAAKTPSAEFMESFVIFLYGASNVFLEHLSGWGKEWTMMDLEHVSITIMFFSGGLLGMLVESKWARELLNTNVEIKRDELEKPGSAYAHRGEWRVPKAYGTSMNPLPALIIFLLGLIMSKHHQDSATSTTIHGQWGTLFSGFALARIFTYLLHYLRPPTSYFPSRPPTELISAFCLVCGGLIFMASTRDVVRLLERNDLHAMFILTVMVGLTCLIMVWTVMLYGLRGWAVRREARRDGMSAAT